MRACIGTACAPAGLEGNDWAIGHGIVTVYASKLDDPDTF